MEKITGKELIKIVEENFEISEMIHDDFDTELMSTLLGSCKRVASHGGEGQGDSYWIVYHFSDHDIYLEVDGYYDSNEGVTPSDYCIVKPVEVMVTQYHAVKD